MIISYADLFIKTFQILMLTGPMCLNSKLNSKLECVKYTYGIRFELRNDNKI